MNGVSVPSPARYVTKDGAVRFAQAHSVPLDVILSLMHPTSFERQSISGEAHYFTYVVSRNSVSSLEILSYSKTLLSFVEYFKTNINGTVEDPRFLKPGTLPKILEAIVSVPIQVSEEQRNALYSLNEFYR
jgi:hypothetical protein